MSKSIHIGELECGGDSLVVIAGPDVIESRELALKTAITVKEICAKLSVGFVFKSSYLKDNRSSILGFSGPGLESGLSILQEVKDAVGVPVTSDIHSAYEAVPASSVLDLIQIPAFLSRQTSLILAAAQTGKPINVKKGQFMDPRTMDKVIEKIESVGNRHILLTERGTTFGYGDLVNDMRSLVIMRSFGYPIAYDAGHSIRKPGVPSENPEGATREFIPALTRAAFAVGCDALFIEVHPDPSHALCDGSSQVSLSDLEDIIIQAKTFHEAARNIAATQTLSQVRVTGNETC